MMISPCRAKAAQLRLGAIRAASLRHRPVQIRSLCAASAARTGAQHRLLGQAAHSEAGSARADPDAGSLDAHRGVADRSGRLDRGAVARCDPPAQIRGHADRHQRLPARLAVHAQFHARPVQGSAGAAGGQLRDQPAGRGRSARRHRDPRTRCGAAERSPITAIRRTTNTIRKRRAPAEGGRLPAVQGDLRASRPRAPGRCSRCR